MTQWLNVQTPQDYTVKPCFKKSPIELNQIGKGPPKLRIWSSQCVQWCPSLKFWICEQYWYWNWLSGQNGALRNPTQFSVDNLVTFGNVPISVTLCISHGYLFFSQKQKNRSKIKNKNKKQTTVKIKKQQNKELFLNIVF